MSWRISTEPPVKTKYRVRQHYDGDFSLDPVQIVKESEYFVFLPSGGSGGVRRAAKMTEMECYFDSAQAAVRYLMQRAEARRQEARLRLQEVEEQIRKLTERSAQLDKQLPSKQIGGST